METFNIVANRLIHNKTTEIKETSGREPEAYPERLLIIEACITDLLEPLGYAFLSEENKAVVKELMFLKDLLFYEYLAEAFHETKLAKGD